MATRAAILCLLLGPLAAASRAGEAPPEGAGPGEAAAAEPAVAESVTRYQYVETLEITGGGSALRLTTNALVIVTTGPNTVTVELRSETDRKTDADAPPTDMVTVLAGGTGEDSWDIRPLVARFTFGPWAKGTVKVEGLNEAALREAASVLGQGPVCNTLEPDGVEEYRIALESGGRPVSLEVRQKNESHSVDWKFTPRGALDVGERGWTIPVSFRLPEQPAGGSGMRLAAEAKMTYSSAVPGPEEGVELVTTLTYPRRGGELKYKRTCALKEIPGGEAEGKRPDRSRLPSRTDLGGKASAWARTATLATLGVQRLEGVREAGLAIWVAQLGVDSLAGAEVPRVADAGARASVGNLAKLSPGLGPLSIMPESDIGMRNLVRAEAVVSGIGITAKTDTTEDSRTSGVPMLSIAMRRKVGERWRIGGGIDTLWMNTNTENPDQTWFVAGIMGRGEYDAGSSTFSFSAGLAKVRYDMFSPSLGSAWGDFMTMAFGFEWEWWSRKKLGLGAKLQYAGGDGMTLMVIQPSVRWRLGHNRTALQFHATILNATDTMASEEIGGGEISAEGMGGGAGIVIRW